MVITLDKHKRPLGHCTERAARKLMEQRRAVIYRYFPMVIIIKDLDARVVKPSHNYRIKLDLGAKVTGLTVVEDDRVILFMQIEHRGEQVVDNLRTRNQVRRNRRSRETGYRKPKFKKGKYESPRPEGWMPPSQHSIGDNVIVWVNRIIRYLGPCDVSVEMVKFDTQLLQNHNIEGEQYQHGTLYGYELKEYLKEKYANTCQYCGGLTNDHRLEWEHKIPRSRGGSDSVDNATLACHTCNNAKGDRTPDEWLAEMKKVVKPSDLILRRIECTEKVVKGETVGKGLRYAAWCNTTRWYIWNAIKSSGGVTSMEYSTGGRTAYNRNQLGVAKDHHLDAMCVGKTNPEKGYRGTSQLVLYVRAEGRGSRLRGKLNNCGIIVTKWKDNTKRQNGFQTGDIVKADIPDGKYKGSYTGRVTIRHSNTFMLKVRGLKRFDVNIKHLTLRQHVDGYSYAYGKPKEKDVG